MKDNQIYFNVRGGKVKLSFNKSITFPEFLQIVSTGILAQMQTIVKKSPKEIQKEVKEEIYDIYNAAASNTLSFFAPEIEMRPHLTSQAILEAEDNIIRRKENNETTIK